MKPSSRPGARRDGSSQPPTLERPTALPEAIHHHTGVLLLKIANFVRDELDLALQPHGLRVNHYNVLSVLHYKGTMSQQGVGTKLRIDRATMVAIVDDLERQGLLERRRNATDRRVYDLTVTDAGRKAVKDAERALKALEARVFEPLGADGRTQLHALLEQLTQP